ncbi:YfhO family protein [Actinophytocola sediminis]
MSRVLEDEARHLPGAVSTHEPDGPAEGDRPTARLLSLCLLGAVGAFTVVGIGWPLVGRGVFAPTDLLANWSPYAETVLAGVVPDNRFLQDVADGVIPQTVLLVDLVVNGSGGAWNPYVLGGVPLGAVPNNAVFNPLTLPYWVLPAWLAPAWVKVAEIAVSVGGTFLFARRLGLGRPAALVGGLAFTTSAFLLAWTGWPQTRTAAFVPVLFWAVERLVTRRRPVDGVLVALATGAMLLGGFPAVTGYALLAAGVYFVVRLGVLHRGRRLAGVAAGGVAAVAGGVGLAAFQLLPFAHFMSQAYVWGREQTPADHLPFRALITAIAPDALGSAFAGTNIVEALSYVGAATVLLAVAGVAAGRALLPGGVWLFLVAATGVAVVLTYAGGLPLAIAQRLPVLFADNFVGRLRSVLGLLVAVLAAVGFEAVLRRHRAVNRVWGPAVWVTAGLGGLVVVLAAWPAVTAVDVLVGLAFLAVAGGLLALAWWGRRPVALAGIPLLVAAQALLFAGPYWAHADRDTFYPRTPVHEFLAARLGHDRYASPVDTLLPGESSLHRLRGLTGHGFADRRMGELVEALPGRQFRDPPTLPSLVPRAPIVTSPILDRLAVRYFVASTASPVIDAPATPVVLAEPAVVYEREHALARIRWAGTAVVEPATDRRLALLARGYLGPDQVLLDRPAGASSGAAAVVEVVEDGTEAIEVTVAAEGAGYLVVADALRTGWQASVDGAPAELLAADHALVAVPVDTGRHTVRLTYTTPYHSTGTWLSAATGASLFVLLIVERLARRRQYASTHTDVEPETRD